MFGIVGCDGSVLAVHSPEDEETAIIKDLISKRHLYNGSLSVRLLLLYFFNFLHILSLSFYVLIMKKNVVRKNEREEKKKKNFSELHLQICC